MAGRNTLRFSPTEVAADNITVVGIQGDTAHRAGLNTEFAESTLIFIKGQNIFPFLSEDGSSRTSLDAGCRLTVLAD